MVGLISIVGLAMGAVLVIAVGICLLGAITILCLRGLHQVGIWRDEPPPMRQYGGYGLVMALVLAFSWGIYHEGPRFLMRGGRANDLNIKPAE